MYNRLILAKIQEKFFKGKVIIITGARQVGKTTLVHQMLQEFPQPIDIKSFNADNPTDRELLSNKDLDFLIKLIGTSKIVFIDEGQKVNTIGQTLKLMGDSYKTEKQILVTGSSSINLLDSTEEPLTGRKYVFSLFPLSLEEIFPGNEQISLLKNLEHLLIFGSYPEVVLQPSFDEKISLLHELTSSYLYKDIFEFKGVLRPSILTNLLKALALQVGSEVSYHELANLLGIDKKTVERYIDLLEKNFVLFRLSPYTNNKRREISRSRKVYFYDLGIRNALINNFNFIDSRNDIGALWENFMILERMKYRSYHNIPANQYFWRTYDGSEVDLIEEREGKLFGYEFKWNPKKGKTRRPSLWLQYPQSSFTTITPREIYGFIYS